LTVKVYDVYLDPMSEVTGTEADRAEIMRLHREWWESNREMDHARMRKCFVEGDRYYQFNLNGHPYYGIDQKVRLWQAFGDMAMLIPEIGPDENLRLEIRGDMAWLACENVVRVEAPPELNLGDVPRTPFRVRSTEVYQRDDGNGAAVWRIWHIHCSPSAPPDVPRLGFGDTYETRLAQGA
jgi:hypothetical protein